MSHVTQRFHPLIRRLWPVDQSKLADHFHRLDAETRRLRFGGHVADDFVDDYADRLLSADAIVFGAFLDGELRGVAELRGVWDSSRSAEVALLVEPDWQEGGIGEALFNRLLAAAQNRRLKSLHMLCLRENGPMRALAKKHHASLEIDASNIEATLAPTWPTPLSLFEEAFGHPLNYLPEMFYSTRSKT